MENESVSETIFHFTAVKDSQRGSFKGDGDSFMILKRIIEDRSFLMTSHTRSLKNLEGQEYRADIWMSCFSETPLNFLKGHVDVFGKFGIGVSTRWGRKQNAHNVIYVDFDHVPFIVEQEVNRGLEEIKKFKKIFKDCGQSKVTKGDGVCETLPDLLNSDIDNILGSTEQYCFRSEREWRIFSKGIKGKIAYTPKFEYADIDCLICPLDYIESLQSFIREKGFNAKIVATEEL